MSSVVAAVTATITPRDLRDYQQRRLALADMVRSALYVARSRADDSVEKRARALLARLAEDRLRLAVAGQFSRGKTTLMNAILGGEYLPTGALPMTSVVTTVTYGSTARATVRRLDAALPIDVPVADLADYVARSGSRRSVLQVVSADVELPADVLRLGFAFVDTPGVGSDDATSTATTRQYLPEADAAVFVTGFDSPLTAAELAFVSELRQRVGRLFVVINKRDLVTPTQASEVEAYVSSQLAERGLTDQSIHSVSALQALEARKVGDQHAVADSGLVALEDELLGFLTKEKSQVLLDRAAHRAEQLVADLQKDLRLGELGADAKTATAIRNQVETDIARLEAHVRQTVTHLDQTAAETLSRHLESRRTAWRTELGNQLSQSTDQFMRAIDDELSESNEGHGRNQDMISRLLAHFSQPIYEAWWEHHIAETREALTSAAAELIADLTETNQSVDLIIRRAMRLSDRQSGAGQGWSVADVPSFSIAAAPWTTPVEFGRRARRRGPTADEFRTAIAGGLEAATARANESLCDRLTAAVPRWVERFADVAQHDLDRAVARFTHQLATPPSEANRDAIADLNTALPTFRAGLHDLTDNASSVARSDSVDEKSAVPAPQPANQPPATDVLACVICSRLQRTLSEQLSHEQFRLATLERAQAEHARDGGFCRLHTWEYAAMASPVGISAGYAQLAETLAATLEAVASPRGETQDRPLDDAGVFELTLSDVVRQQVKRTDSCRVCAALARVETEQATRIARRSATTNGVVPTPVNDTPVLCLHHLAAVLAAGPDANRARAMTQAMATRLRRASEDMRSFALAREAIRRGLVTAEENKAYEDVLRLLAGLPALARLWTRTED